VRPVIHVEHPGLRIVRHHDKDQGALGIVDPLLDLTLGPTAECQDESILFQAVETQAFCTGFVHLQDSADNQSVHIHVHVSPCL
jgi:hypothetical protein